LLNAACLASTNQSDQGPIATAIRAQAQLGELASQVKVVEGYYDLETGKVEWSAK